MGLELTTDASFPQARHDLAPQAFSALASFPFLVSNRHPDTRRRMAFRWTAALATFAFGTAAGDLTATISFGPQLATSRRPLPKVPATTYAGKRLYLLRHGGKEWLDEDRHSRIAVETHMGQEVAGVEGLYLHVTLTMEQEIAYSLQTRWLRFVAGEGEHWKVPSPTALSFDLEE
ncbi:hypothetical protein OH768_43495 [Streptomyces sp. NBC_01622]|uniref:hypothetical protein n=1 Tax=Streptomyces sp. NBC_01622 TaxID=2975903 RepID=UPI00386D2323|nr:hypothetical protein OH768_43495 [Streptomyces sp. NBC_01622]